MTKRKSKLAQGKPIWMVPLGLVGLALLVATLLRGADVALFNPKGLIATEQHRLILVTVALMLMLAIPTLLLLYFFAWKYRESNDKAVHEPRTQYGKLFVVGLWVIPSTLIVILASIMLPATHKLEPLKPIASDVDPLTIQVVALRWKWLFIYPEQNIATVNFVQVPVDTPVRFELTADEAPMSSFWIPHLGGQLYAMTGHVNRLNLMADTPGDYPGSSAEINGPGFAGMKFITRASSQEDFDAWVQAAQRSPEALDSTVYGRLLAPSENHPPTLYSQVETNLYDKMLKKYMGSHDSHTEHE
jgi:cytochrome o ubiquinol oxidase subunit 2